MSSRRIGIGVVGVRHRWVRVYLPALRGLADRFRVVAVADELPAVAEAAARQAGCRAAAGVSDLLFDDAVEAVVLLEPAWFGLWPLERAAERRLPVLCGITPLADEANARRVGRLIGDAKTPVLATLPLRDWPTVTRARELITRSLGAVRWVDGATVEPGPLTAGRRLGGGWFHLLDLCLPLLDEPPARVRARMTAHGTGSVEATTGRGVVARVTRRFVPDGLTGPRPRSVRVDVGCDHGTVSVRGPTTVSWTQTDGRWTARLHQVSPAERRLLRLFDVVCEGQPAEPDFPDFRTALRSLSWLQAARRSRDAARAVAVEPE